MTLPALTLFGDDIEPFQMPAVPPPPRPVKVLEAPQAGETVDAWVKSWRDGRDGIALPTLLLVPFDAHVYRPARFRFAQGTRVGLWPASQLPGVRVDGEKSLITLYEAVQRGLATEIPMTTEAEI